MNTQWTFMFASKNLAMRHSLPSTISLVWCCIMCYCDKIMIHQVDICSCHFCQIWMWYILFVDHSVGDLRYLQILLLHDSIYLWSLLSHRLGRLTCVERNCKWWWHNVYICQMLSFLWNPTKYLSGLYLGVPCWNYNFAPLEMGANFACRIGKLHILLQIHSLWTSEVQLRLLLIACLWVCWDWYGWFFCAKALCWCRLWGHSQTWSISTHSTRG